MPKEEVRSIDEEMKLASCVVHVHFLSSVQVVTLASLLQSVLYNIKMY